jgi:hypothetical protein
MPRLAGRRAAVVAGALLLITAASLTLTAQRRRGGAITIAQEADFDGGFQFCRVAFRQSPDGDGGGWSVDYPQADRNVTVRLSELTRAAVRLQQGEPNHLVTRLTDDALFRCPFVMMTEVGTVYFDNAEAERLRAYLLKGGFLWADDFWGDYAWDIWQREIRKVLPAAEYPIVDLPLDHPIYRTQFVLKTGVPQISSINFWLGAGHTSERGAASAQPHGRAILDAHGRVLVFMSHNTDIGDSWEREGEDPDYFRLYSVNGYGLGIDVLLYAMTH